MSLFASPMFLSSSPPRPRRYRGEDYARRDRGYHARYARRASVEPLIFPPVNAWPACTLARVGDAWVVQDCARAA